MDSATLILEVTFFLVLLSHNGYLGYAPPEISPQGKYKYLGMYRTKQQIDASVLILKHLLTGPNVVCAHRKSSHMLSIGSLALLLLNEKNLESYSWMPPICPRIDCSLNCEH